MSFLPRPPPSHRLVFRSVYPFAPAGATGIRLTPFSDSRLSLATQPTRSFQSSPLLLCRSRKERPCNPHRFSRLALGFSKKLENLAACVCLYIAHYNYCRMHGSLPGTPAMAARIAGHPWTMEELLEESE
jgi:hypothetical protein